MIVCYECKVPLVVPMVRSEKEPEATIGRVRCPRCGSEYVAVVRRVSGPISAEHR